MGFSEGLVFHNALGKCLPPRCSCLMDSQNFLERHQSWAQILLLTSKAGVDLARQLWAPPPSSAACWLAGPSKLPLASLDSRLSPRFGRNMFQNHLIGKEQKPLAYRKHFMENLPVLPLMISLIWALPPPSSCYHLLLLLPVVIPSPSQRPPPASAFPGFLRLPVNSATTWCYL